MDCDGLEKTLFLALDKCLKRRSYIQVLTMTVDEEYVNDNHVGDLSLFHFIVVL